MCDISVTAMYDKTRIVLFHVSGHILLRSIVIVELFGVVVNMFCCISEHCGSVGSIPGRCNIFSSSST